MVQEMHIGKIRDLFQEIDEEHTGIITYETFQQKMHTPEVRSWLVVSRHPFFVWITAFLGRFFRILPPGFYKVFQGHRWLSRPGTYFQTIDLDVWDAWSFFKLLDLDEGRWKRKHPYCSREMAKPDARNLSCCEKIGVPLGRCRWWPFVLPVQCKCSV